MLQKLYDSFFKATFNPSHSSYVKVQTGLDVIFCPFCLERNDIFLMKEDTISPVKTDYYMQILINKENSAVCLLAILWTQLTVKATQESLGFQFYHLCFVLFLFWIRTDYSAIFECDIFPLTSVKYCAWSFCCFLQLEISSATFSRSRYHFLFQSFYPPDKRHIECSWAKMSICRYLMLHISCFSSSNFQFPSNRLTFLPSI